MAAAFKKLKNKFRKDKPKGKTVDGETSQDPLSGKEEKQKDKTTEAACKGKSGPVSRDGHDPGNKIESLPHAADNMQDGSLATSQLSAANQKSFNGSKGNSLKTPQAKNLESAVLSDSKSLDCCQGEDSKYAIEGPPNPATHAHVKNGEASAGGVINGSCHALKENVANSETREASMADGVKNQVMTASNSGTLNGATHLNQESTACTAAVTAAVTATVTAPTKMPENPAGPPENPAEPPENPAESPENPAESPENLAEPPENPAEPPENPAEPPENPVKPPENRTEPPEKLAEPPEKLTEPPENPTEPPENPAAPPENLAAPLENLAEPPENPTEPPENPAEPLENQVEPLMNPAEPLINPAEPPENPAEPLINPAEPPEDPAEEALLLNQDQSLTGSPIQEEAENNDAEVTIQARTPQQEEGTAANTEGTTDNETDPQQAAANSYENLFVSEVIQKEKFLLDKLACKLDHTAHRSIRTWEHLACTEEVNAPLETRLRCKLNSENSCTLMLIDLLAVEKGDKTVGDMIAALKQINRNDVVKIITDVYIDAANSTEPISDFAASSTNSGMIKEISTKLDQKSRVNAGWIDLGRQFKISGEKLKEIECGQYNPTEVLIEYLYTKEEDPLKVGRFYGVVKKLSRGDVLKILKSFFDEDPDKLMKDAIPLESDEMRKICVCLNTQNRALKNWRQVAYAFSVPRDIYKDFNPEKPKSPTKELFDWIFAKRTQLKVGQLCAALKHIGRNDVVRDLRNHFGQQHTGN